MAVVDTRGISFAVPNLFIDSRSNITPTGLKRKEHLIGEFGFFSLLGTARTTVDVVRRTHTVERLHEYVVLTLCPRLTGLLIPWRKGSGRQERQCLFTALAHVASMARQCVARLWPC